MPIIKGLEWTFDTVASEYARLRPGYPAQLYEKIFAYIPICQGSKVLFYGIKNPPSASGFGRIYHILYGRI